ncbi:zinc ribbon domain-containing protein [Schnuerera ultunensis]|uniref:zinc ribbon domain-containing protein n=1 Tax=Schnuerera ultunensis TaxID=45497 RepID=UPI0004049A16|nr:C4-type zinc ribbon domain-containing protein [Schnuerera ultunensis]
MGEIEGLWELQKHTNILKDISKNLKEIGNGNRIKALGFKLEETEKRLLDLENKIEERENRLNKGNLILKEYDSKLQEIEKSLYEGNISDLKQLTFLNQERENITKKIEEKEMEILNLLEEMEELKKEFILIKEDFQALRKEYKKVVNEYKSFMEELKREAVDEKKKMEEISSSIDKELLKKYNELRKNRGRAVVEVIDNRCSGCNMVLPAITLDRLKNNNLVLYCENCDRMLYLNK